MKTTLTFNSILIPLQKITEPGYQVNMLLRKEIKWERLPFELPVTHPLTLKDVFSIFLTHNWYRKCILKSFFVSTLSFDIRVLCCFLFFGFKNRLYIGSWSRLQVVFLSFFFRFLSTLHCTYIERIPIHEKLSSWEWKESREDIEWNLRQCYMLFREKIWTFSSTQQSTQHFVNLCL